MKKIIPIIGGICGILGGIGIIIMSIADMEVPKLFWLLFAAVCFINAFINIYFFRLYNKKK